jgi:hypothetical protein
VQDVLSSIFSAPLSDPPSLILQLSLEVRWRAAAAPFPMTDLGEGLMQASPE